MPITKEDNMKEDSQLITELLYNQDFDVNTALAAYLNSQARYTNALAARQELETKLLKEKGDSQC